MRKRKNGGPVPVLPDRGTFGKGATQPHYCVNYTSGPKFVNFDLVKKCVNKKRQLLAEHPELEDGIIDHSKNLFRSPGPKLLLEHLKFDF